MEYLSKDGLSKEQFNRQANAYAKSVPHSSSESLEIIRKLAAERRYDRALDIATGPGFTAFAISPFCEEIIASDIAEEMLLQVQKLAKSKAITNITTITAEASSLPFEDESFDLVTCRTAPHHFPSIRLFLNEVNRILSSSGFFLIADTCTSEISEASTWHNEMEKRRDPSHNRCLSKSEWIYELDRADLPSEFDTSTRVHMQFDSWTKRSATPTSEISKLKKDWNVAPQIAKQEFQITKLQNGDFSFSWPVFVSKSKKRL